MAVSLALVVIGDRVVFDEVDRGVRAAAEAAEQRLARAVERSLAGGPADRLDDVARDIAMQDEMAAVVVIGSDRRATAAFPRSATSTPELAGWPADPSRSLRLQVAGVMAEAYFVALGGTGDRAAGAWIAVDLERFERPAREFRLRIVVVLLFALAASVLLAVFAAASVTESITHLSDTVARLGQGELELRHPERGPREVERLARHVNRVAALLAETRSELAQASAHVDGKVRGRTRYLEQTNRALIDLANRDPLTGLANRRRLELDLERQIQLARQSGNPLAVIMMDLDDFKTYNDSAGHLAGDSLLLRVAETLRARTRITDLVVRWGGDEFCILIPYTAADRAVGVAQALVEAVNEAVRALLDATANLGASAGVACYPDDAEDGTALISAADAALYQVKQSGRGRVLRLSTN
jgi:diguanylate cyclase (GGDEF)-like protein